MIKKIGGKQISINEMDKIVNNFKEDAIKLANLKPSKDDVNLYGHILKSFTDEENIKNFRKIVEADDPFLINRNDIAQRLSISVSLMRFLYKFKDDNPDTNIILILKFVPYYTENKVWLNLMLNNALPLMVNNKII